MIHGLSENEKNIKIIVDRKKAIIFSLKIINKKDFLIIAGKGHENFQIVGEKKYIYDKETVLNYLEKLMLWSLNEIYKALDITNL